MFGILLSACATFNQPKYFYNEILIINNSRQIIQDVQISASKTGRGFSCGNIAPRGICSNKNPQRLYEKSPIRIDWVFGNSARQTNEFVLEVPATMDTTLPLRGVLEISPQGAISAYFEQDRPIR
jgi:hypothetical protein